MDRKHVLSKKQTSFRFLQQVVPVSISLSFPRMVENGGTGASSTGKSLLEELHETGGGKEVWETQNKITESDDAYGKGIPWNEVFARNSVGLDFKSMCRDEHGYSTSPTGTDRLPSEATVPIVAGVKSYTRLLRKGCFRLIYNTKHWFVFFIPEKQKNPAGTL